MTKIKICGITRLEDAELCAELGVEFVGFVFVRESARWVEAEWVRGVGRPAGAEGALIRPSATFSPAGEKGNKSRPPRDGSLVARGNKSRPPRDGSLVARGNKSRPSRDGSLVARGSELTLLREARQVALLPRRGEGGRRPDEGPLRVGVFRNSPLEDVRRIAEVARLDIIQLHGDEDEDYVRAIELPVIKVVELGTGTNAPYVMFDSGGGTGRTFDWSLVEQHRPPQPFFLAGGLRPANVAEAIRVTRPYAVDVSSGVESSPGIKDHQKLRDFVNKVRQP